MQLDHDNDATRPFQPLVGGLVAQYRVLHRLGAGGMGEVYLAEDTRLHRKVALKFLPETLSADPDLKARFMREAQATARLNHQNIVTVYEVGEHQGGPYIAMEYIDGHPLHYYAHEHPLPVSDVLDLISQVADGLAAAHQAGITHRDIKSVNIVVGKDGRARVLDFGLATLRDTEKLTRAGTTMGTVAYMSPEQVAGKEVDHRSDLFSLGVVLYELLAGRTPFRRDTDAATMRAILADSPEPLSRYKADVPAELQRIVARALDKDRDMRYQSAADLSSDLKRLRRSMLSSEHAPIVEPPGKPAPIRALKFAIPGTLVIVLLVVALVLKPWQFEISSSQSAKAAGNRLAVMYFDNLADPTDSERLGEIITNLIITDLSDSKGIQVVSSQRLYDILKLLGREGQKTIDREVATQIAQQAEAAKMLTGTVLQTSPKMVVTAQVVDVASGEVLFSERVTGEPEEDVFALVDKLNQQVRTNLALPISAEDDRSVAEVTTHSKEAYRLYLEGVEYLNKMYDVQAREKFLQAIAADSTFAMAYFYLALNPGFPLIQWSEKAMQFRDHVTERERLMIESLHASAQGNAQQAISALKRIIELYPDEKDAYYGLASMYYVTGRGDSALPLLNRLVELDPLNRMAYNMLAYSNFAVGDTTAAFAAIDHYTSLASHEPNPYDSRGDLYAYIGQLDRAMESYREALKREPSFFMSRLKLADILLLTGRFEESTIQYDSVGLPPSPLARSIRQSAQATARAYRGEYDAALELISQGLQQDSADNVFGSEYRLKLSLRAQVKLSQGLASEAADELAARIDQIHLSTPGSPIEFAGSAVDAFVHAGRHADAQELIDVIGANIPGLGSYAERIYHMARGRLQLATDDPGAAESFHAAIRAIWDPDVSAMMFLGQAYLKQGRAEEAVTVLEGGQRLYDQEWAYDACFISHYSYHLARAYEESGRPEDALKAYSRYLEVMQHADPGIAEVADARARLAQLNAKL